MAGSMFKSFYFGRELSATGQVAAFTARDCSENAG